MSKGKDISTMFTREENKKNGRAGYYQADSRKLTLSVLRNTVHSCRKEGRENEQISISD